MNFGCLKFGNVCTHMISHVMLEFVDCTTRHRYNSRGKVFNRFEISVGRGTVGNELVHVGSHARPQAVDRGMPSQGGEIPIAR